MGAQWRCKEKKRDHTLTDYNQEIRMCVTRTPTLGIAIGNSHMQKIEKREPKVQGRQKVRGGFGSAPATSGPYIDGFAILRWIP